MKFLDPINKYSFLLLRVLAGLMFSFHGVQKLFGILSQYPAPAFGTQLWFGGLIELVCGLLIAVNLKVNFNVGIMILFSKKKQLKYFVVNN